MRWSISTKLAPRRGSNCHVTFADFAATEARFGKHFRKAPPETWNDAMIPLADLLALPADERGGRFPYIWATDPRAS